MASTKKIYFLVDYPKIGDIYGKYKGTHPKQAASKVLTFLCDKYDVDSNHEYNHILFTITDEHKTKLYSYVGTRVKLENNKKIDGSFEVKYKNVLYGEKMILLSKNKI